jgi:hypothetical protein
MIEFDESAVNVTKRGKTPLFGNLGEFALKVSLAKPMINYVVDDKCINSIFDRHDGDTDRSNKDFICQLNVYENGERLGSIGIVKRYHGSEAEYVYQVESFRIEKSRGNQDAVTAKDMKVALRHAKKSLVPRANDEAKHLIKTTVSNRMSSVASHDETEVRWCIDSTTEGMLYAKEAYKARLNGETTVTLPTRLASIKDMDDHNRKCDQMQNSRALHEAVVAKRGYGIQVQYNGGMYVVCMATDTIQRYNDFESLPENIQSKFAMFKVLAKDESVATIGCKFENDFFYVAE